MPSKIDRKPGRPVGSRTKANTVGKKRARRFFDLTIDDGLRPTEAAKRVSEEFETPTPDVFKAAKRHEPALAKEVNLEAAELERQYAEMQLILEMGPHELRGEAGVLHTIAETLKGNTN